MRRVDVAGLRAAAEAARNAAPGEWRRHRDITDDVRADPDLGVWAVEAWGEPATVDALTEYVEAANPSTVLALIAENGRLREALTEAIADAEFIRGFGARMSFETGWPEVTAAFDRIDAARAVLAEGDDDAE